jgi:hypothetical protein
VAAVAEFETLLAAMRAELAALDDGDTATISAATAAKLAALAAVRRDASATNAAPASRATLETAHSLNALASARVNMLMAGIERRLRALTAATGETPSLCYGRDGRTSAR